MTQRDMISVLPKDITDHILERIPIQDAVRTSVLCRNWKYKWTSIRNLTFDEQFFDYLVRAKSLPPQVYLAIIKDLLENYHDGNIDSFTLYVPDSDNNVISALISILSKVSLKDVKQLTINYKWRFLAYKENNSMGVNTVSIYYCSKLTHLRMEKCVIIPPPMFGGFPSLVSLQCQSVTFFNGSFTHLFSKCPLIESLALSDWYSRDKIDICSTRLKHLKVAVDSLSVIDISAPNLETLYYDIREDLLGCGQVISVMTPLNSLKVLYFHGMDLGIANEIKLFINLVQAAPNLQVLDVMTTSGLYVEEGICTLKTMDQKLEKLETMNVHLWDGGDNGIFLIERLLSLTPFMKKMKIVLHFLVDRAAIADKIMSFPRASQLGEVEIQACVRV